MLDRVSLDVDTTANPPAKPVPLLDPTLLDDVHRVPMPELPPNLVPMLQSKLPTNDTTTVTLTHPVVPTFVRTVLLNTADTPA